MKRFLIGAAALLAVGFGMISLPAQAQGFRPFGGQPGPGAPIRWHGSVDDTVNVYIQGSHEWSETVSGKSIENEGGRVLQPLPAAPVNVYLTRVHGRGSVTVFQQPHRRNGYTTGIRICDPQDGRSNYFFGINWN